MEKLKNLFKAKADAQANEVKELLKEHGTKKIGEVQLAQRTLMLLRGDLKIEDCI